MKKLSPNDKLFVTYKEMVSFCNLCLPCFVPLLFEMYDCCVANSAGRQSIDSSNTRHTGVWSPCYVPCCPACLTHFQLTR